MNALTRALALTVLASAVSLPAHADRGGHGHGHGRGHWQHSGHHQHHGHHGHHGHHRGGVWGPLIVGGLIGAALVGASQAQAQPVQSVVVPVAPPVPSHLVTAPVAPPLVTAPPQPLAPRVQYYCAPYRAYYPFVATCPEPWYVMPY